MALALFSNYIENRFLHPKRHYRESVRNIIAYINANRAEFKNLEDIIILLDEVAYKYRDVLGSLNKRIEFFKKIHHDAKTKASLPQKELKLKSNHETKPDLDKKQEFQKKYRTKNLYPIISEKNVHEKYGLKKEILDRLLHKIIEINKRGAQLKKAHALKEIYFAFIKLDFTDKNSIKNCQNTIRYYLKDVETFDSPFGKLGAWMKQSIFKTGYAITMSNSRLLVGELNDFIEKNAFPQDHVRYSNQES